MRMPDYLNKLFFCARISARLPDFFRLIYRTKLFSVHRKNETKNYQNKTCYKLNLPAGTTDIMLRNYAGDIDMFYETFWRRDYALPVELRQVSLIVDLGANIGMTVQWWAALFPSAIIVAVEPDPQNFELLKHNTRNLASCYLVQAAIGNQDGRAYLSRSRFAYNSRIGKEGETEVEQLSMQTLMQIHNVKTIDLLKIDIEGGEKWLLSSNINWLNSVKCIVMEIHDGCESVMDILLANGFQILKRPGAEPALYIFIRRDT